MKPKFLHNLWAGLLLASLLLTGLLLSGLLAACAARPSQPATAPGASPDSPSPVAAGEPNTSLPLIVAPDHPAPAHWQPATGATWHIQFTGEAIDTTPQVEVYILDLFETEVEMVQSLHAQGRKVVCYINAGGWEDWRPDAGDYPAEVLGNDYEGWEGEKWLDIRRIDLLAPILERRLDQCKAKGFDGVDPDNTEGYTNDTGFPLTAADQLRFNRWLAGAAHQRGLAIGLKNDPGQAAELQPDFDWALTESCFAEDWCNMFEAFITAGKPIFSIEYTDTVSGLEDICPRAQALQASVILKNRELDGWMETCP